MSNARSAYREADVRGASPVRLVILLYEQAIQDLREAVSAMEKNNIELRTNRINHAIEVIARLQVTLDKERGGAVARNLESFYEFLRAHLCRAQLRASKQELQHLITDLFAVREAWMEVDRTESLRQNSPPEADESAPPGGASSELAPAGWSG